MSSPSNIKLNKPLTNVRIHFWGSSSISLKEAKKRETEAFEQGQTKAKQEYESERQSMAQSQSEVLNSISKQFEDLTRNINERIPSLVLGITQKVLGNIEPLEENILTIVNEAIEEAPQESRTLKISLSQKDNDCIQANLEKLNSSNAQIAFAINDSLKSGDCLIESDFGLIDAKTSTKLKKIEESLKGQ